MLRIKPGSKYGFTIVELLVVISVITILVATTVTAYNGIQGRSKQSKQAAEITQWRKEAHIRKIEKGIHCADNFVFVYGNPLLGTDDFCVMKYEARNTGSNIPISQPTNTPWVNITQANAIAYAPNTAGCTGCKLITELEWMTIAADVLSVKYNWSGGEVGSGFIYSGHSDNSPASALSASNNDSNFYVGTGNTADSGQNQRRTLYLSSGDIIWDIAGNIYELTNATLSGGQPVPIGESTLNWRDWSTAPQVSMAAIFTLASLQGGTAIGTI